MATVMATRGDGIYLIDIGDGQGVVLHPDSNPPEVWPPQSIDSHLKFGYWEDFEGDPQPIMDALDRARQVETPGFADSSSPSSSASA
jgi:hypothetical protein